MLSMSYGREIASYIFEFTGFGVELYVVVVVARYKTNLCLVVALYHRAVWM